MVGSSYHTRTVYCGFQFKDLPSVSAFIDMLRIGGGQQDEACRNYADVLYRARRFTIRLLEQGCIATSLKSSHRWFIHCKLNIICKHLMKRIEYFVLIFFYLDTTAIQLALSYKKMLLNIRPSQHQTARKIFGNKIFNVLFAMIQSIES